MARHVVTVGSFDGVHLGHAGLLARARSIAGPREEGGRVTAMAFFPHPMTMIRPEATPPLLTTLEQRVCLLAGAGADQALAIEPTREFLEQSPEAFVAGVVERLRPDAFVEGMDFRFGRGRAGDVGTLRSLGERYGFETEVIEPVETSLSDQSIVTASSSITRWLLAQGRVEDAARVLGRVYEMVGVVVPGDRRGRQIGFPTANIDSLCMPPRDGVYAGVATLSDGSERIAAISVGTKPTFEHASRAVEAHLLDWSGVFQSGAEAGYGWPIRLRFTAWLRDQIAYASVERLLEQMSRDVQRTREIVERAAPGVGVGA